MNKTNTPHKKILITLLCFLFIGTVYAVTTISDTAIFTTGNVTSANINQVLYVQAGNASDINETIKQCGSNGCVVKIPCGTYNLDTQVTIKDKVFLEGFGECTIINRTGTGGRFKSDAEISDVRLSNFRFKGNNFTSIPITLDGGFKHNIQIYELHITNVHARAIQINGTNILIENNLIVNVTNGIGISKNTADTSDLNYEIVIINNRIEDQRYNLSSPTEYGEGIEINVHSFGRSMIMGNDIIGFGEEGIDVNIEYSIITNNYVEMVSDEARISHGINIQTESSKSCQSIISSNVITNIANNNNSRGIKISSGCIGVQAIGNILEGINSTGGRGITVDANKTIINSNYFSNLERGIQSFISEQNVIVTGNRFTNITREFVGNVPSLDFDNLIFNQSMTVLDLVVGNGASQHNITLTSPDGAEHNCGVNNAGVFTCT